MIAFYTTSCFHCKDQDLAQLFGWKNALSAQGTACGPFFGRRWLAAQSLSTPVLLKSNSEGGPECANQQTKGHEFESVLLEFDFRVPGLCRMLQRYPWPLPQDSDHVQNQRQVDNGYGATGLLIYESHLER